MDGEISLDWLHEVMQAAFGWTNSHLHAFIMHGTMYTQPIGELWMMNSSEFEDSTAVTLSQLMGDNKRLIYLYDSGDSWEHVIKVEKIEPLTVDRLSMAKLVKGRRACPPEDVGGVWGYEDFLESIARPNTEKGRELLEWVGGEFDAEAFDFESTQREVLAVSRRKPG